MVRVFDQKKVKADVMILGCSLPGIVTAHKLKSRFGNSMDIVVLDLAAPSVKQTDSKCGVIFQEYSEVVDNTSSSEEEEEEEGEPTTEAGEGEANNEGGENELEKNPQTIEDNKKDKELMRENQKDELIQKYIKPEVKAENTEVVEEDTEEKQEDLKLLLGSRVKIDGMRIEKIHDMETENINEFKQEKIEQMELKSKEYKTAQRVIDNVAKYVLEKYAKEFKFPIPVHIISPLSTKSPLSKLFQDVNGEKVEYANDYYDFKHLSVIEKFELNQYQTRLDNSMRYLFLVDFENAKSGRDQLLYYDGTTMEADICCSLYFNRSREIMRMTVRLVCGASPDSVSVLFYLHQCYRTNTYRNQLDGHNTRLREKLLGYCRKHLANKLQQSVADITVHVKPITGIHTCADAKVVLETRKGEITYVCNLLAMALKPDQLHDIEVGEELLSSELAAVTKSLIPGRAKKFLIRYTENFWGQQGYSGDIISIRGPIIWAMEMPELSTTGRTSGYSSLVGFLDILDDSNQDSKQAVVEQLVKLFGEGAAEPVSYKEKNISDVYIPRYGDYVALRRLTASTLKNLEWSALDIFADGDVVAALEAGHSAYINLLSTLRPQAQTFEDISSSVAPITLGEGVLNEWLYNINIMTCIRWSGYMAATVIAVGLYYKFKR